MTTSNVPSTPAAQSAPLAPLDFRVDPVPADGHYYAITAPDGRLLASLLVLLDSHLATTRAELCYYDDKLDRSTRDAILRRARNIVGTDYHSGSGLNTQLSITQAEPQTTFTVDHMNGDPTYKEEPAYPLWRIVAVILVAFVVVLLIGLFLNRFGNRASETAAAPAPAAEQRAAEPVATESEGAVPAVQVGAPEGVDPASLQENRNGLPASTNANPALALGSVAVMREGYNSYIRSQPGAEAGEAVGYLQPGDRVTIIGGPTWQQGDTDTIVWWYVRTDAGATGWAPANTSTLMLLEPAP